MEELTEQGFESGTPATGTPRRAVHWNSFSRSEARLGLETRDPETLRFFIPESPGAPGSLPVSSQTQVLSSR